MFNLIFLIISLLMNPLVGGNSIQEVISPLGDNTNILAAREFSMEKRYGNEFVNDVFRDNILLTIDYLSGEKIDPKNVSWDKVTAPATYKLVLKPGETFAFHDDVLPEYQNKVTKTTNAHFNAADGFKSSGYLYGDGVCHLASFLYWVALDAGLEVNAPTRHDFAKIPEVPREFGVSIYATPGKQAHDQVSNLYITNNKDVEVVFEFTYDGQNLKISATETEVSKFALEMGKLN